MAKYLFITISGIWSNFCFLLITSLHSIVDSQLGLSFLREILGVLPNDNTELHIYVIKASSVITTSFLCQSNFQKKNRSQRYSVQ